MANPSWWKSDAPSFPLDLWNRCHWCGEHEADVVSPATKVAMCKKCVFAPFRLRLDTEREGLQETLTKLYQLVSKKEIEKEQASLVTDQVMERAEKLTREDWTRIGVGLKLLSSAEMERVDLDMIVFTQAQKRGRVPELLEAILNCPPSPMGNTDGESKGSHALR